MKINRIIAAVLSVCLLGGTFFVPVVSYKEDMTAFAAVPNEIKTDDGLTFELNHNDQTAILRAYDGWKAEIVVPSTIDVPYTDDLSVPYTVTKIAFADDEMDYSFKPTALEKITIPGTVEELNGTFSHSYWWSYLKEVVIEEGVKKISGNFLYNVNYKFIAVTIPKSVTTITANFDHNTNGYAYSEAEHKYKGIIKGYSGSVAEEYAKAKGYIFLALSDPEQETTETPTETTTTAEITEPEQETTETPTETTTTAEITEPENPELSVKETEITLKENEQYKITANQSDLVYKSSNTDVAVVSKSGIITAWGLGNAIISVMNSDGDVIQIKVTVSSEETAEYKAGDANLDGNVSISDAVAILQYLANSEKFPLDEQGLKNADVDGIAGVTGKDAAVIQLYDAKAVTELPIK